MNNDAHDDATEQPVSFNNEATPDVAFSPRSNTAPTAGSAAAASIIVPEAHIPPSGQKQHTKPFSPIEHVEDGQ